MDRFWMDFQGGSTSAASRMAAILEPFDPLFSDPQYIEGPGRPVARITNGPMIAAVAAESDAAVDASINQGAVRLDASGSLFVGTFSWELTDDATGMAPADAFLVGADTAKPAVRIRTGGMYTATLTVTKTRSDGSTSTDTGVVQIDAMDNAPKQVLPAQAFMISESLPRDEITSPVTRAHLEWIDLDNADPSMINYTVTSSPAQGTLSATTFTQQDINDNLITYTEGTGVSESSMNDSFIYTVSDSDGISVPSQLFSISVVLRNDIPTEINNGPLQAAEAESRPITTSVLQWLDEDHTPTSLTYEIGTATAFGVLQMTVGANVTDLLAGATFTQDDVDSDRISYSNTTQSTSDSFTYTVTDGTIPAPLSPAMSPFQIAIQLVTDTPALVTNDLNVPAGLENSLAGAVSVVDTDTAQGDITLTLTAVPANGHMELGAAPPRALLGLNDTFTAAQISQVFYVHDQGVSNTDDDAITLMVSDGDPGTADSSAGLTIIVDPRTDNPSSQGTLAASLDGYLGATSRSGNPAAWADTPPWNTVSMNTAIQYATGPLADPNKCTPVEFTVITAPNAALGVLRRVSSATPFTAGSTFTQDEVNANQIIYDNRAFSNAADSFVIQASDCVLVSTQDAVNVSRNINAISDVGWVMDTVWTDVTNSACRTCHAQSSPPPTVNSGFTTTTAPNGTIQCTVIEGAYGLANALPGHAGSAGHGGGNVIGGPTTNPRLILQQWQAEGFPKPPGCP